MSGYNGGHCGERLFRLDFVSALWHVWVEFPWGRLWTKGENARGKAHTPMLLNGEGTILRLRSCAPLDFSSSIVAARSRGSYGQIYTFIKRRSSKRLNFRIRTLNATSTYALFTASSRYIHRLGLYWVVRA